MYPLQMLHQPTMSWGTSGARCKGSQVWSSWDNEGFRGWGSDKGQDELPGCPGWYLLHPLSSVILLSLSENCSSWNWYCFQKKDNGFALGAGRLPLSSQSHQNAVTTKVHRIPLPCRADGGLLCALQRIRGLGFQLTPACCPCLSLNPEHRCF